MKKFISWEKKQKCILPTKRQSECLGGLDFQAPVRNLKRTALNYCELQNAHAVKVMAIVQVRPLVPAEVVMLPRGVVVLFGCNLVTVSVVVKIRTNEKDVEYYLGIFFILQKFGKSIVFRHFPLIKAR